MKMELKYLKNYLGTGLKCQYFGIVDVMEYHNFSGDPFKKLPSGSNGGFGLKIGELKEIKIYKKYWKAYIGTFHGHLKSFINGYDFKLCLLPLSALTEPLQDGRVPIVELAKIMYPNYDEWRLSSGGNYAVIRNGYMTFEYDLGNNCFLINNSGIMDQMKCYEYLFANHFDVYGLIPANLAIDKRTIKKTP